MFLYDNIDTVDIRDYMDVEDLESSDVYSEEEWNFDLYDLNMLNKDDFK